MLTQEQLAILAKGTAALGMSAAQRMADNAARDMAASLAAVARDNARRDARALESAAYFARMGYDANALSRIGALNVLYSRASIVRANVSWSTRDQGDLYRAYRLEQLHARITARIRTVGAFPVSAHALAGRQAQDDTNGARVIVPINSARYHLDRANVKYGFAIPGIDAGDVLNVAAMHAIESGDVVMVGGSAIPTYGMFPRHIKFAASHFHRAFFAELRGDESPVELERPMRLGTYIRRGGKLHPVADRDDSAAAMGAAKLADERAAYRDALRWQAIRDAASVVPGDYARAIASLLASGATVEAIADASGVMPRAIVDRVSRDMADRDRVVIPRPAADAACDTCDETDRDACAHATPDAVTVAQNAHADRLRAQRAARVAFHGAR